MTWATLAVSTVACAISVAVLVWNIRLYRRDDARERQRRQDRETERWEAEKRARDRFIATPCAMHGVVSCRAARCQPRPLRPQP